jgi:hypothetical protein
MGIGTGEMNAVLRSPVLLAMLVTFSAVPAVAQMPMGGSPMGSPMGWPAQPQQVPPCVADFMKLRDQVQKLGLAAKAAHDKNASREEMCKLITNFSAAEEKMVKFATVNSAGCGIPADAISQMKDNHNHSAMIRKQICSAGPAPAPVAPTLSDALGTSAPTVSAKDGKGMFDTLTGNPLTR